MAAEANRGSKLVATTALVIAAILAYYYWTETNISRELFEHMRRMQVDIATANQTIRDQRVTTDTQKEQLWKLEEEKKKVEAEKGTIVAEKAKLEEEKRGWDARFKEATDNVAKLTAEKKAAEDKLTQSQVDCSASCQARLQKAEEDCKRASTTGSPKGFLW